MTLPRFRSTAVLAAIAVASLLGGCTVEFSASAGSENDNKTSADLVAEPGCATPQAPLEAISEMKPGEPAVQVPLPAGWVSASSQIADPANTNRATFANPDLEERDFTPSLFVNYLSNDAITTADLMFDTATKEFEPLTTDLTSESTTVCGLPAMRWTATIPATDSAPELDMAVLGVITESQGAVCMVELLVNMVKPMSDENSDSVEKIFAGVQIVQE